MNLTTIEAKTLPEVESKSMSLYEVELGSWKCRFEAKDRNAARRHAVQLYRKDVSNHFTYDFLEFAITVATIIEIVPLNLNLTQEQAEHFTGFWGGDGGLSRSNGSLHWTLCQQDTKILLYFQALLDLQSRPLSPTRGGFQLIVNKRH
ncbi:hypothetical protein LCGC14_1628980, partial [marine sediment metagenome]